MEGEPIEATTLGGDREFIVLDRGYVRLVEAWGSDRMVIEAARMSTAKGFQGWTEVHDFECGVNVLGAPTPCSKLSGCHPGDAKLLRYLWEHKHHTPFEMAGAQVEVRAPIFVFREWHRHRTQSYNEHSARYAPLPALDYVPSVDRCLLGKDGRSKQAQAFSMTELSRSDAETWLRSLQQWQDAGESIYQRGLTIGLPKEIARLAMSVGRYSTMRAQALLRNWLAFLALRLDGGAQWEIRQYARAVEMILAHHFPRTLELFKEGRT